PPPVPLAEDAPPSPSAHAEWRPGYWQWDGIAWFWIVGQWRVPDSDVEAGLTASASAPPPPPRVEAPPPPPAVRAAVWVGGWWAWDGGRWVWVAGSWQLPPAAQVVWEIPRWVARGASVVLVPGHWVAKKR